MWQNLADFHFWKLEFWNTCWQLSDILGTPYELEITDSFGFLEPDNVTFNALQFVSLDDI